MITAQLGKYSVNVDVVSETEEEGGWTVFDISAAGFGTGDLFLHWGVGKQNAEEWVVPVEIQARTEPPASRVPGALQTAFPPPNQQNVRTVRLEINSDADLKACQFVLHKKPNEWLKNGSRNFLLVFSKVAESRNFRELVNRASKEPSAKVSCYSSSGVEVAIIAASKGSSCDVQAIVHSDRDLVLQYGQAGKDHRWTSSTRLNLEKSPGGVSQGNLQLDSAGLNKYLMFVLHDPSVNQWLKDAGRDFAFELPDEFKSAPAEPAKSQEAFEPKMRLERRASKLFSTFVEEIQMAEPDAKSTSWTVPGTQIEVVILATAVESECQLHVLVHCSDALVIQYGSAGDDRAWKFSKRLPLVRSGTDKYEVSFSMPAGEVEKFLMFVLHDGAVNRWIKHGAHDFEFELPRHEEWDRAKREAEARSQEEAKQAQTLKEAFIQGRRIRQDMADISFSSFALQGDFGSVDVSCVSEGNDKAKVEIRAWLHPKLGECLMHFGVFEKPQSRQWTSATSISSVQWPSDLTKVDEKACRMKLEKMEGGIQGLDLSVTAHTEKDGSDTLIEPDVGGLGFVLKTVNGDTWIKPTDGGDAMVRFSSKGRWKGPWSQVADKIVESETTWNQMSLKRRYENCLGFLDQWEKNSQGMEMRRLNSWTTLVHVDSSKAVWSRQPSMPLIEMSSEEENNEEFWSWIFVWQRFSFQQLLTWERNTCTQPRMLAATTNQITQRLAELWKSTPSCRLWIRWTLSTMGRGGSAGQQIRDEILVIMHGHGIKEIHGTYYEQWHQKLHNNTTPADIGICRAIIAFLRSNGDMGAYWKVLGEHGITKEHLSSYSRPITTEPYMVQTDVGRLIGDFERYLGILRSVHDALDLQLALDHARGCLPGPVQGKLQDICHMGGTGFGNLDEGHGKFMKIASARDDLLAILNHKGTEPGIIKELLVIDYTLETQQSVLVQGLTAETRLPQLCDELKEVLTSLVGHLPQEDELQALLADWTTFSESCSHKCVRPDEMSRTSVGSKSLNLALLKPKLPAEILTPQAIALPYGTMQKSLIDEANKQQVLPMLEKVLSRLHPHTSNEDAQVIFEEAQQIIESMKFPKALKEAMNKAMVDVGSKDSEDRLTKLFHDRDAWSAIKGVWSSLFALRPWVSLAKAGRSFHDLNMAVLVQELVEAKYAFVLHTINPFTKDKDELYGELVAGRGETLVGNFSGRALSFAMRKGGEPRVISFPSKSVALHTQACLIFRSDSNGEDLEGFAGAGLFESICAEEDLGGFQRLHRLSVIVDAEYRTKLLKRIAEVGWATEKAFDGAPQDIEGCVDVNERIYIVQSRPQV
ncbi:unnamed protein product [Effrenium voratum]|uniref:Uncharacterized protein n=1 Tax=Effrenium voratum TaxID=2562239 RepID=A0AA36J2S8_9DINO|nr:unnamed protein product [Effrenium voratum]